MYLPQVLGGGSMVSTRAYQKGSSAARHLGAGLVTVLLTGCADQVRLQSALGGAADLCPPFDTHPHDAPRTFRCYQKPCRTHASGMSVTGQTTGTIGYLETSVVFDFADGAIAQALIAANENIPQYRVGYHGQLLYTVTEPLRWFRLFG